MLKACFDNTGDIINDEFDRVVAKYKKIIYFYANRYYLPGGDIDDLYQWGLLGLYNASLHFDENGIYSFDFIAKINIRNMIKSAITNANRKKHMMANCACSLYYAGDDSQSGGNLKLIDRLVQENRTQDPLEVITDQESVQKIMRFIDGRLSDVERRIMKLYIRGFKQRHISEQLNFDPKVVDNAIQRARKKLYNYLYVQQAVNS